MINTRRKRNKQGGFSMIEILVVMIVLIILMAVVALLATGFFSKARGTTMAGDIHTVKNAVADYMLQSSKAPTETGGLPAGGEYALIDFDASYNTGGNTTYTFYPDFLAELPRHADEGLWRLDNAARVSVDIAKDKY